MPKPMYVWTGTAWVSVASEVESLATYATQSYADAQPGIKMLSPASITLGSGSGSVSTSGAVTFSTASTVSLNTIFSSTYDTYRILVDITAVTLDADLYLRLRTGSTDVTSNYQVAYRGIDTGGSSEDYPTASLGYLPISSIDGGTSSHTYFSSIDLSYPFLAQRTLANVVFSGADSSGLFRGNAGGAMNTNATSYESLTLGATSGTISGTIKVYGYKN